MAKTDDLHLNNFFQTYEYDSLGNLVYEKTGNGTYQGNKYWYNNLNQQIEKLADNHDVYTYEFDNRGNLIKGTYHHPGLGDIIEEQYVYDGTNRMAKGTNESGEESHYINNGLGYLVANEWLIEKNAHGFTNNSNVPPSPRVDGVIVCKQAHELHRPRPHQPNSVARVFYYGYS